MVYCLLVQYCSKHHYLLLLLYIGKLLKLFIDFLVILQHCCLRC